MQNVLTDPTKSKHQPAPASAGQSVNPSTAPGGGWPRAFASAQRNSAPAGGPRPYSLGEAKKTKTKRDVGGGDGAEVRVRAAQAATRALMESLEALPPAHGLQMLSVSNLTAPTPALLRHAAERAEDLLRPGEGLLFVLDVSAKDREHLHGLALLADPRRFLNEWVGAADARRPAQRLTKVTGSDGPWDASNECLRENLEDVIRYAYRRKEPLVPESLSPRLWTASGSLESAGIATRFTLNDAQRSGDRHCLRCGKVLRASKRKHAKWCSPSCRELAYRARRAARRVQ